MPVPSSGSSQASFARPRARSALLGSIGTEIRDRREARGLTLARLGSLAGISYQHLSRIENGYENFSLGALERICRVLEVRLPELVMRALAD